MNIENIPEKKRIMVIILLLLPILISVSLIVYFRLSWQIDLGDEKFSPIENKPLFVSLIIFTVGYIFFLGMMFSDNIIELFNRRISLYRK